ncbi:Ig-like domain-containing protein [Priestia megaterium]
MKKINILILLIVFFSCFLTDNAQTYAQEDNKIVKIPDPVLKRVIAQKLGESQYADITTEEMKLLKDLNYDSSDSNNYGTLYSLEGLQYAENLESLFIEGSYSKKYIGNNVFYDFRGVTSLTPISRLKKLKRFYSQINPISDLTPFKNITSLEEVEFGWTDSLKSLNGIENLTNLKKLSINSARIQNLDAIKNLTNLEELQIEYDGSLKDIKAVEKLNNLKQLTLQGNSRSVNRITDISPLKNLTNLQYLDLSLNNIKDISSLKNLVNLQVVWLNENDVEDINPLVQNLRNGGLKKYGANFSEKPIVVLGNNRLDVKEGSEDFNNLRILANAEVDINADYQKLLINPLYEGSTTIKGKLASPNKRVAAYSWKLVDYGDGYKSYDEDELLGEAKADKDGNFSISISPLSPNERIYVYSSDGGSNYDVFVKAKEDKVAPDVPKVNTITDQTTNVTGQTEGNATVYVKEGSKVLGRAKATSTGTFGVKIAKQKAGTRISIVAQDTSKNVSKARIIFVQDKTPPPAPKVNNLTNKSTHVIGTTEANATIEVKVGTKLMGSGKANSKGSFDIRIPKQKAGTKVDVFAKDAAKNQSKTTKVVSK